MSVAGTREAQTSACSSTPTGPSTQTWGKLVWAPQSSRAPCSFPLVGGPRPPRLPASIFHQPALRGERRASVPVADVHVWVAPALVEEAGVRENMARPRLRSLLSFYLHYVLAQSGEKCEPSVGS